jgi:hypothetical protein
MATTGRIELVVSLKSTADHPKQRAFVRSRAKRKVVRAGRRGGKTTGASILAVEAFLEARRILYAAPTQDQTSAFWAEVKQALAAPIDAGLFIKNETLRVIERPGSDQRIRAKTAWNADTLRGDYADLLILDEWQLMNEEAWEVVGAPMLLDNNGDAVFIYTPPSLHSRGTSKARDPRHAAKLFQRAQADTTGRWEVFHFTSHDNPHISDISLAEVAADMTHLAYRQEILAEDVEEAPGALWTRATLVPQGVFLHRPQAELGFRVDRLFRVRSPRCWSDWRSVSVRTRSCGSTMEVLESVYECGVPVVIGAGKPVFF